MHLSDGKRRVALFRNNFLPYSETFIHDELMHHVRYEATVMARHHRNYDRFPGHRVVAIEQIPGRRDPLPSIWYGLTARSSLIDRAIQTGGFDLLHAHFGHNGLYAMPFAHRHQLPLVVTLHGRDVTILLGYDKYKPPWWLYWAGHQRLFTRATIFMAASTELKRLIESIGCPPEKVVVHRLGVDIDRFSPSPDIQRDDPPLVLMIGRFVEKKGHLYGIEAAGRARNAGHRFRMVIVGEGPFRSQYERAIREWQIGDYVTLAGVLSHGAVRDLMQRATVIMAPSIVAKNQDRESGIIVLKEAAACGVPTIGTRHGGIPDIIDDGTTGFLVSERHAEELGDRLSTLLAKPDLRRTMAEAARKKMVREYDIKKRTIALEDIYDSVIERVGAKRPWGVP